MGGAGLILIDTHILVWWLDGSDQLPDSHLESIRIARDGDGVAVSIISFWEIAKKVAKGKLTLSLPVDKWIHAAGRQPGIAIVPLTPEIILDSTQLPENYCMTNTDPADQLIVATSRIEKMKLMTMDRKILLYNSAYL